MSIPFQKNKAVVGLDIGQGYVKAIALRAESGRVAVECAHVLDRESEGILDDVELANHLRAWLESIGMANCDLIINLPQYMGMTQGLAIPASAANALEAMVAFQVQQVSELAEESFHYDYCEMPGGEPAGEVLIGVCRQTIVTERIQRYRDAGLEVAGMALNSLAMTNAAFGLEPALLHQAEPQVLLDIGMETATLVVVTRGRVAFTGSLSFGCDQFFRALAQNWQVTPEEAARSQRRYRITRGAADDPLTHAAERLARELLAGLEQWREQDDLADTVKPTGLYICGGGATINGLQEYLQHALLLDVQLLTVPAPAAAPGHALVAAYGLALQGLGLAALPICLAPAAVKWERQRRRRVGFLIAAAVVLASFFAVQFISSYTHMHRRKASLRAEMSALRQCGEIMGRIDKLQQQINLLERAQFPLVEYGNRGRRFAAALQELSLVRQADDWFVYVGDEHSFVAGKQEVAPVAGLEDRQRQPIRSMLFGMAGTAEAQPTASNPDLSKRRVVDRIEPLEALIVSGYTRLLPNQSYQPVREIVRKLNTSELFAGADLLAENEKSGREDILQDWRALFFSARRSGDDSIATQKPFTLRLPLAVQDVVALGAETDLP